MKNTELKQLIKEVITEELKLTMFNEKAQKLRDDKLYLKKSLNTFNTLAEDLFLASKVEEACQKMKRIKEAASNVILTETDDQYDKAILSKNIKIMDGIIMNMEKNIVELKKSESKIEDDFDTFGRLIEKYFKIN